MKDEWPEEILALVSKWNPAPEFQKRVAISASEATGTVELAFRRGEQKGRNAGLEEAARICDDAELFCTCEPDDRAGETGVHSRDCACQSDAAMELAKAIRSRKK